MFLFHSLLIEFYFIIELTTAVDQYDHDNQLHDEIQLEIDRLQELVSPVLQLERENSHLTEQIEKHQKGGGLINM